MTNFQNLMNGIWYGEISGNTCADIKERILRASTEQEVLFYLIELFKLGDFSQKPLLIQLMNHTEDRAVLNHCIRVFCSIATHEDLRDPDHLRFLASVPADMVHTFASAVVTSLSLEAVPYLLALLEDWDEVPETSTVLREAIDAFIDYEEPLGLGASIEEIGHYYWKYYDACDTKKYYFNQKLAFPGNLTKKLIERVLIAANGQQRNRNAAYSVIIVDLVWTEGARGVSHRDQRTQLQGLHRLCQRAQRRLGGWGKIFLRA